MADAFKCDVCHQFNEGVSNPAGAYFNNQEHYIEVCTTCLERFIGIWESFKNPPQLDSLVVAPFIIDTQGATHG